MALDITPADERNTWQFRVVKALQGNRTMLGTIFLSVIGRPAKHPPMIGPHADIDLAGIVYSDLTSRKGVYVPTVPIGNIGHIRDEFRRVADKLKLPDADRLQMFAELRKWIRHDARSTSNGEFLT